MLVEAENLARRNRRVVWHLGGLFPVCQGVGLVEEVGPPHVLLPAVFIGRGEGVR
jgi:hypothetical protein